MKSDQIPDWLSLSGPPTPGRQARMAAMLADGARSLDDHFLAGPAGLVSAGVRVERLHDHLALLIGPFLHPDRSTPPEALAEMMQAAVAHARSMGTDQIGIRPLVEVCSPALVAVLSEAGFTDCGQRIEFRAPVADLPDDDGSPLTWQTLDAVGDPQAARMLAAVSIGDPHGLEPDEDPAAVLAGYRAEGELTRGPDCVQIGSLAGEAVALVCAQVAPSDGWSRITYMGLIPSARGRGLGKWLHRRGFVMLKAQGGRLYHGGTAASNAAMLRLFRQHGCAVYRRMSEWLWVRPVSG